MQNKSPVVLDHDDQIKMGVRKNVEAIVRTIDQVV